MSACCSTFARAAEQQFDQRKVAKEVARFRRKGPGPTNRLLEQGIAQAGLLEGSLLDVGPRAIIERTIRGAGFALSSRRETWMWSADVYVRDRCRFEM